MIGVKQDIKPYKDNSYHAVGVIILIYLFALFASYLYVQINGVYNGDFIGDEVSVDSTILFVNLVVNTFPFILLWFFYRSFKKKNVKDIDLKETKHNVLFFITVLLLLVHVFMAGVLGVGVLAGDTYEVNSMLKIFIQIFYRFQPQVWAFLFILSSRNNQKIILVIVLLVLLAICKHSMGGIWILMLVLLIRYYEFIKSVVLKHKLLVLILLFMIPFTIRNLYILRNELRGNDSDILKEFSIADLLAGQFAGRLSCFSNTTYIFEEPEYFFINSLSLQNDYYIKQALKVVFGVGGNDLDTTPEKIMISVTGYEGENVSFMTGVFGNFMFSFMKSPLISVVNLVLMLLMVWGTFKLMSLMYLSVSPEVAFISCLIPMLSGVSSEFAYALFVAFTTFFIYSFFCRFKFVIRKIK